MTELSNQEALRQERIATCPLRNCPQQLDEEMTLRGIRSGRLLCVKCAVPTPTGYIAKEVARAQDDRFFKGDVRDYAIAMAVCGIGMGLLCGVLSYTGTLVMIGWYFAMMGAPVVGGALAEAALRLSQRRRGRYSDLVGAVATAIGGAIGAFVAVLLLYGSIEFALQYTLQDMTLIVFIAFTTATVYARFKLRI